MAASPIHISSHVVWSRPHTSESVSRRDPPILSIHILQSLMDLVATAQLSFPVVCIDASQLSNCSAPVTEMLLCCSAFASLDQKSLVVSSHFHTSISSIISTKASHKHSSKVRFKLGHCSVDTPRIHIFEEDSVLSNFFAPHCHSHTE